MIASFFVKQVNNALLLRLSLTDESWFEFGNKQKESNLYWILPKATERVNHIRVIM